MQTQRAQQAYDQGTERYMGANSGLALNWLLIGGRAATLGKDATAGEYK